MILHCLLKCMDSLTHVCKSDMIDCRFLLLSLLMESLSSYSGSFSCTDRIEALVYYPLSLECYHKKRGWGDDEPKQYNQDV